MFFPRGIPIKNKTEDVIGVIKVIESKGENDHKVAEVGVGIF
ncbi:MAG: hypothetical protein ACI9XR_001932 [Flavobacterium sp.]|jgi:uncharacterized protein GlcG (DUF336 family)